MHTDGRLDEFAFDLSSTYEMSTLEPGGKTSLRLKVGRERMTASVSWTLLKVSNAAGAVIWVPVVAQRDGLSSNP